MQQQIRAEPPPSLPLFPPPAISPSCRPPPDNMEQTVIWPCTEEITASSRTVQHRREQLSSEQHSFPHTEGEKSTQSRNLQSTQPSNCSGGTSLPLFSFTLAERRLVAHTSSVKADLFRVQQSAVQCCGSLYSKCHFLQQRSDVIKTDQTTQAGHMRGITHVESV